MKIPRKPKIIGMTWTVVRNAATTRTLNKRKQFAAAVFDNRTIPISTEVDQERAEEVFFHEVVHIILEQTGLTEVAEIRRHEEQLVQALGHGIYQVLKDNKLLKQ
jgi:hypothetical protein